MLVVNGTQVATGLWLENVTEVVVVVMVGADGRTNHPPTGTGGGRRIELLLQEDQSE